MAVDRLAPVNVFQERFLPSYEFIICELPSFGIYFSESIGVELSNEAGEIIVFKVHGEQIPSEIQRIPHDKAATGLAP